MTVNDLLYICDSSVNVAIVDLDTDLYILPPDSVGFQLTLNHWVLNEEVEGIYIKEKLLVIGVKQ